VLTGQGFQFGGNVDLADGICRDGSRGLWCSGRGTGTWGGRSGLSRLRSMLTYPEFFQYRAQ
jgi:hypothetical protein